MKKMRVKSRKQQEETEKWKEQVKLHEGRLRRVSTNYGKAKEDKKRLIEEINVLERKFKYAGLRTSPRRARKNAKGVVHMEASSMRSPKKGHLARECDQGKGC